MTQALAEPPNANSGQLFQLATSIKTPHQFGAHFRVRKEESPTRFEQIERVCASCGLVKITVMQGIGARAYRYGGGEDAPQFDDGFEPDCKGILTLEFKGSGEGGK